MTDCKVCGNAFSSLDHQRQVCFDCSKIDHEKMYHMARKECLELQQENEQLRQALSESTETIRKATRVFGVIGFMELHYYPYTKQIEDNEKLIERLTATKQP